jgi:uncharacterized protein DUF5666
MLMFRTAAAQPLRLLAHLFLAAALLSGCGGGGGSDSSAPAGSSFTAGPITGFGSIIVNGVRFDISRAKLVDDEGRVRTESDLQLGMMAQVQAGDITGSNTGQATQVQIGSAIIGPVDAINTSTRLLIVLGQTIDVADTTVFGPSLPSGPFSISVGTILEIFGMLDTTTGHYQATRIEARTDATFFKLQGVVSNLDSAGRTFMIGGETISFADLPAAGIPPLSDGKQVTAILQMQPDRNNRWIASQLTTADQPVAAQGKVKLRGFITSFDSPAHFSVNGIPVDASNAKINPKNAALAAGVEVKVEGGASNGTIIANKVSVKKHGGRQGDANEQADEEDAFELHGFVSRFNASSQTFVLRGVTVTINGAVVFNGGARGNLTEGSRIEVKGKLSPNGTGVEAQNISFEH